MAEDKEEVTDMGREKRKSMWVLLLILAAVICVLIFVLLNNKSIIHETFKADVKEAVSEISERFAGEKDSGKDGTERYDPGTTEGRIYENEYFGFRIAVPEGWDVADGVEIARVLGYESEDIDIEDLKRFTMETKGTSCEMIASSKDGTQSVNVTVTDGDKLYGKRMTEEEIEEIEADGIIESLSTLGISDGSILHNADILIGDRARPMVKISGNKEDRRFYEKQMILAEDGMYAVVTMTSLDTDTTDNLNGMIETTKGDME